MLNVVKLKTPISEADVRKLKTGDIVYLTGRKVYVVAMTTAAKYLFDSIERRQPLFDLKGSVIYHCPCGFLKLDGDYKLRWVGATTSIMNEPVTPKLISLGARVIMGKGGMGKDTLNSMQEHGAVFLATVGGASSVLARGVTRVVKMVDLSIWLSELELKDFGPTVVGMDAHGHSLFEDTWEKARKKASEIMEE